MALVSRLGRLRRAELPWLRLACMLVFTNGIALWYGQEASRAGEYTLFIVGASVFYYAEEFLKVFADPREPPLIPYHGLPFLGHVIGMFWYGAKYFEVVNQKTNYPIYTLQTLTGRSVIVISPYLAAPIQRASKNVSFYSMIMEVTKRLIDLDEESMKIIRVNLNREDGDHGLMNECHDMIASILSPGPMLNHMSGIQLEKFSDMLNDMVLEKQVTEIGLNRFVKHVFTTANAATVYGPRNPFAVHPELVPAFWDYEAGMIPLLANVFPSITAQKPYLARKAMNDALQEFVETEAYKSASPMIQKRVAINLKHGLTTKMTGHAELIMLFGILGNAVPTSFWLLANIFSRPDLLARIREETTACVTEVSPTEKVINVSILKTTCPLLVSTYRETLRSIANLSSVRLAVHTHTVSTPVSLSPFPSTYLLKKGSMIQIASGVIHAAESVWGSDAQSFNPERFISSTTTSEQFSDEKHINAERTATQLPKGVTSAAYRAFGGGSVICPGRHFAQSEILGFVALCLWMFDMRGVDGGPMRLPKREDNRIPLSVMKPDHDPMVKIQRRSGEERVKWRLEL